MPVSLLIFARFTRDAFIIKFQIILKNFSLNNNIDSDWGLVHNTGWYGWLKNKKKL